MLLVFIINCSCVLGAEPTTSDFTVMSHGTDARFVQGMQLVSDKTKHYSPLQKFGQVSHTLFVMFPSEAP